LITSLILFLRLIAYLIVNLFTLNSSVSSSFGYVKIGVPAYNVKAKG